MFLSVMYWKGIVAQLKARVLSIAKSRCKYRLRCFKLVFRKEYLIFGLYLCSNVLIPIRKYY